MPFYIKYDFRWQVELSTALSQLGLSESAVNSIMQNASGSRVNSNAMAAQGLTVTVVGFPPTYPANPESCHFDYVSVLESLPPDNFSSSCLSEESPKSPMAPMADILRGALLSETVKL